MSHDACELHNLTHCGICHRDAGQCDFGSCQTTATHRLTHETGRDVRKFCRHHATAPHFGFARAGFHIETAK